MTDRYSAFLVILDQDIRDDDAKQLINAMKMLKGVADVLPQTADPVEISVAQVRFKQQLIKNILEDRGHL